MSTENSDPTQSVVLAELLRVLHAMHDRRGPESISIITGLQPGGHGSVPLFYVDTLYAALVDLVRGYEELRSTLQYSRDSYAEIAKLLQREHVAGPRRSLVQRLATSLGMLQEPRSMSRPQGVWDPTLDTVAVRRNFQALEQQAAVLGPGAWVFLEILIAWIQAHAPAIPSAHVRGDPEPLVFGRWLPELPSGWVWRADDAAHLLPVPSPIYLWRATQVEGGGDIWYGGTHDDSIEGVELGGAGLEERQIVRARVIEANREALARIRGAWFKYDGSDGKAGGA